MGDPLVIDFAIWEGGVAEDYLAQRGELLPADERKLIEEPRRLWEVMAVDPGTDMTLRDTATGDRVTVTEYLGSLERGATGARASMPIASDRSSGSIPETLRPGVSFIGFNAG